MRILKIYRNPLRIWTGARGLTFDNRQLYVFGSEMISTKVGFCTGKSRTLVMKIP